MTNKSSSGSFADSLFDAMSIGNVLLKILMFFVFGLITATPYLIYNLDTVAMAVKESGTTGVFVLLAYLQALWGAVWKGMFLGLSTLFDAFLNIGTVISEVRIGTMIFSITVLLFATLTTFQPIRLTFNILDLKKGREHSKTFVFIVSAVVTLVILSPVSWLISGGETITSGVEGDVLDGSESGVDGTNQTNQTDGNESQSTTESIIASINMLDGDTS